MVAQVFREKYFQSTDFLNTKLRSYPSFIWRSIWSAGDLLKEGLYWRVGNGAKVKIWGERWLSTPSSLCVQSPLKILNKDDRVVRLIYGQTKEWDEALIQNVFLEKEANQIVKSL